MKDINFDKMWHKKYAPTKFEDIVLPKSYENYFKKCIESKNIPDLIFHSKSKGVGKTTVAKIIGEKCDYEVLHINASIDTGINIIRNRVKPFCSKKTRKKGKLIVFEESDRLSENAQKALLDIIDKKKNTSFILTCNNKQKMNSAILSRLVNYSFDFNSNKVKKELISKMLERIKFILNKENVKYKDENLKKIIEKYYPSLRNMIKNIQVKIYQSQSLEDENIVNTTCSQDLINSLKKFKIKDIFNILNEEGIAYENIFTFMKEYVLSELDKNIRGDAILITEEYMNRIVESIDEELTITAYFVRMYKLVKSNK